MEARSRKLDAKAKRDAELDLGINQNDAMDEDAVNEDDDEGGAGGDLATFDLPTADEREEEKARGGGELYEVQRRIQDCVRVLTDFKALAAKGR